MKYTTVKNEAAPHIEMEYRKYIGRWKKWGTEQYI